MSQNISVQEVSEDKITVNVNGELKEIQNQLSEFKSLLEGLQSKQIQSAEKIYNIGSINEANFSILTGRASKDKNFPEDLQEEIISDKVGWTESLKQALLNLEGVVVGNKAKDIFEHYGWLVETFFHTRTRLQQVRFCPAFVTLEIY